jgi:sialidase-1
LASALTLTGCGDVTHDTPEDLPESGPVDASVNGALQFDGVDDYASVGTARSPQIQRDQSLMLWFRPAGAAAGASDGLQVLFTLRRSDWSGIALALDHEVPLAYNVYGPRDLARAKGALAPGVWHHLACVVQGTATTLYLDGEALASGPAPATKRTPLLAFIGSIDGYSAMFHGAIDELRVYDRAFTADELAAVAAGERPEDAEPPVMYLPFDELSGARSFDRSGLRNHAELGDGIPELMPERIFVELP